MQIGRATKEPSEVDDEMRVSLVSGRLDRVSIEEALNKHGRERLVSVDEFGFRVFALKRPVFMRSNRANTEQTTEPYAPAACS